MVEHDHPRTLSNKHYRSVLPGRVLITRPQIGRSISGTRKITKRLPELFFGFSYHDFFTARITYHCVGDSIQVHWIQTSLPANILDVLGIRRRGVHQKPPSDESHCCRQNSTQNSTGHIVIGSRMRGVLFRASTRKQSRHGYKQHRPNRRRRQASPKPKRNNP